MDERMQKVARFVDRSIPYCLVALVIIILLELFFHDAVKPYHHYITIADSIVIGIFVFDLVFKYIRVHHVPTFLKRYWIEIIALFPAFLVIRIFEEFAFITSLDETVALSQETIEVGERTGSKANRVHYFSRFAQPLARIPRFLKAFTFYERHHH